MKRNPTLIFGSVVVAGLMMTGAGWAQSTDSGKSGSSSGTIHPSPKGTEGGSRSERSGESGVPLPKGSPQSGTVDMGKSGGSSGSSGMSSSSGTSGMSGSSHSANRGSGSHVKEVQQALKDKGYDPGPIDGVMGAKTKEALKSFQSASNLSATGTLNSQTAEKLGVQSSSSSSGSSSSMETGKSSSSSSTGSGSMRSKDTRSNSDTTKGKDTDQPNK